MLVGLPDLAVSLVGDNLAVGDIPAVAEGEDIPLVAEEGTPAVEQGLLPVKGDTQVQVAAGLVVAGLDNLSVLPVRKQLLKLQTD